MRIQIKLSTLVLVTVAAVSALSVSANAFAKNPKEVNLEITNDQLVITSKKGDNDCPFYDKRENGCIKLKKGETSEIYFHLKGDTKCNLEYGTDWELNAVYLGGYNSSDKPGAFGFDTTNAADFKQVDADFSIADKSSGRVNTTDKSAKKMAIKNNNQSKYLVWYQIEAICERTDGNPPYITTSDPRIKNGGTE
jgi:hypothetical protein